ncbi:uncharacterized protein [Apostichopus japonicus]|uniref:uncharacterized protein n=1 Tax=Stichopus japonicus TaxID=307972 RepID=UPI003AB27F76
MTLPKLRKEHLLLLVIGFFFSNVLNMLPMPSFLKHRDDSTVDTRDDQVLPPKIGRNNSRITEILSSTTKLSNDCHQIHDQLNSCHNLPNYFLYPEQRQYYSDAIINFWHVQKSGGTSIESCMGKMYKKNGDSEFDIHYTGGCRTQLDMLSKKGVFVSSSTRPILRGHNTLGLCDFIHDKITTRKCSTFAIFREPYDRVVSRYFFSRDIARKHNHSNRISKKATLLSITDWVKYLGSVTKQALTNRYEITERASGERSCRLLGNRKLLTEMLDEKSVVDGVLEHLDRYLSVVGLQDELQTTLKMLQKAYNLTFTESCGDVHVLRGSYEGLNISAQNQLKAEAKRALLEDKDVGRLMRFDVRLYNRVKEIFYAQKRELEKME